jgi:hypothetical protein
VNNVGNAKPIMVIETLLMNQVIALAIGAYLA